MQLSNWLSKSAEQLKQTKYISLWRFDTVGCSSGNDPDTITNLNPKFTIYGIVDIYQQKMTNINKSKNVQGV